MDSAYVSPELLPDIVERIRAHFINGTRIADADPRSWHASVFFGEIANFNISLGKLSLKAIVPCGRGTFLTSDAACLALEFTLVSFVRGAHGTGRNGVMASAE